MSIAVLTQVYDEVRRLAIAGSGLAAGDFRLKKLVGPLEKSAEKAPVFGKVAQAIQKLLESSTQDSAAALLELSTLTSAILYTQGETGLQGELKPLETTDMGLTVSATSARVLKPLLEALTTTGSGRHEIIKDAHDRGAFKDLRLIKPAIKAIDDSYAEIGDFVAEKILPMYGKAIYGEIKAGFDHKGKGDDARRLKLLHALDPQATHPLVEQTLEDGSKDVKLAALTCLGGQREAIPYLLDQAKAKAREVRAAALQGLALFDDEEIVGVLTKALGSADVELVACDVAANPSPRLRQFVLDEAQRLRDALLSGKEKDKAKQKSLLEQLHSLLDAFADRKDAGAEKFLTDLFEQREKVLKLNAGQVDGDSLLSKVCTLLLLNGYPAPIRMLVDSRDSLPAEHVGFSFVAAAKSNEPKDVYSRFSAIYLSRPDGKKKDAEAARARSEAIGDLLRHGARLQYVSGHAYRYRREVDVAGKIELDPQWLDAAVQVSDVPTVLALARPGHAGLLKFCESYIDSELASKKFEPDGYFGVSVSNLGGKFGRIMAAGDASMDFDAQVQGGRDVRAIDDF